jgi:type IV secretory pathway TraG/TraD family ATPase VirD4
MTGVSHQHAATPHLLMHDKSKSTKKEKESFGVNIQRKKCTNGKNLIFTVEIILLMTKKALIFLSGAQNTDIYHAPFYKLHPATENRNSSSLFCFYFYRNFFFFLFSYRTQ